MYTHFAKFLCVAAFASTALAQTISIISPQPGASFKGGERITVQLKESALPGWETIDEVALVIRAISGTFDGTNLGNSDGVFQGVFQPQQTDGQRNQYANYTITTPDSFVGSGSVNVAHYYLIGSYGTSTLEYANVTINVHGNTG